MATDKRITELPAATTPLVGTEKAEIVQGGVNKQVDVSELGGSSLGTDRTVTGASASIQADNNSLVTFNSATPFNFTLDQLTADTKISFVNIGAGAVTLIAGTGVTITGEVIIPAAVGTDYPSAFVKYYTTTTPRVFNGTSNRLDLHTADTSGATITLDFELKMERMFIGSASFATAKTIALSNDGNALVLNFVCTITNVAGTVDFPTTFTMQTTDSRWTDASHRFTPATTGKHEFSATWDGTDWNLKVTNAYA